MVGVKRKTTGKIRKTGRHGKYKSRSKKMKFARTPGGRTVVHFKKKKTSKARCAWCGATLPGVLSKATSKMKKTLKSSKKSTRPFGGKLCSRCMRRRLIKGARK